MSDPSFRLRADTGVSGIGSSVGQGATRHRRMWSVALKPPGMDFTGEGLAFVHAHVRIGQKRGQVVGVAADHLPGKSPVEGETDLVDHARPSTGKSYSRRVTIARASIRPRAPFGSSSMPP